MILAAIESSGLVASVAIVADGVLLAEYTIDYKKTQSQTLLPMFEEIVRMTELDLRSIDAIAVSKGPGSFTGLRIGSATAKGLGLALDIPLVEVSTLEAMAFQLYGCGDVICTMMDARRGQVYTGLYTFKDGEVFETLRPQEVTQAFELAETINRLGRRVVLLGDGTAVYEDVMRKKLAVPFSFAPAAMSRQRAGSLASLAAVYYREGETVSADLHSPEYLRLSQAERERLEKEKQ